MNAGSKLPIADHPGGKGGYCLLLRRRVFAPLHVELSSTQKAPPPLKRAAGACATGSPQSLPLIHPSPLQCIPVHDPHQAVQVVVVGVTVEGTFFLHIPVDVVHVFFHGLEGNGGHF